MNRAEFQRLAEVRLREAEALLAAGFWDGAYYLAGYAVECGLKACILRRVGTDPSVIFVSRKFSDDCWTHDLTKLVKLAGLTSLLDAAIQANSQLSAKWGLVVEWTEAARYEFHTAARSAALFDAVTHPTSGVMPWIRTHW